MSLKEQEILQEFTAAKAILKGHFILSSGLHLTLTCNVQEF